MNNMIFEQVQKVTMNQAVIDEKTIRYVFKPAPRFIPERLWFTVIAKFFVREEHRK